MQQHGGGDEVTNDVKDEVAEGVADDGEEKSFFVRGALLGLVAGAAFDVFENEPAKENPLFNLPNVVCTPHLGASTTEAQENVALQVAEQMSNYLLTGAVENALNMPSVTAEEAKVMGPWIKLADHLGGFIGQQRAGRCNHRRQQRPDGREVAQFPQVLPDEGRLLRSDLRVRIHNEKHACILRGPPRQRRHCISAKSPELRSRGLVPAGRQV